MLVRTRGNNIHVDLNGELSCVCVCCVWVCNVCNEDLTTFVYQSGNHHRTLFSDRKRGNPLR